MKTKAALIVLLGLPSTSFAGALTPPDFTASSVSTSASLGWLAGESKEYVYDPDSGKKISQLNWKIKNTAILKADFSWDAWSWLTVNARGWTSLASGSGQMDDYDWLDDSKSGWSDWSHHDNTTFNYANEFDLNLKGWLLQGENYKAGAVLGYQQTRFSWTASGGRYNYDNGESIGEFPLGERGIGYSQKFTAPYIGLVGQFNYRGFEVNALMKFSDWATAKDNDEHYARSLTFREKATDTRYYAASVDIGYYVTPQAKVFTELSYSRYKEGKGGTEVIDRDTGEYENIGGNAAGIANKNYTITAGLSYRF